MYCSRWNVVGSSWATKQHPAATLGDPWTSCQKDNGHPIQTDWLGMCQQEKKTMQSEVMYIFWKKSEDPPVFLTVSQLSFVIRLASLLRPQWYWSQSCLRSASRDALTPGGCIFLPLRGGWSPQKWCPNLGGWHAQRFFPCKHGKDFFFRWCRKGRTTVHVFWGSK